MHRDYSLTGANEMENIFRKEGRLNNQNIFRPDNSKPIIARPFILHPDNWKAPNHALFSRACECSKKGQGWRSGR